MHRHIKIGLSLAGNDAGEMSCPFFQNMRMFPTSVSTRREVLHVRYFDSFSGEFIVPNNKYQVEEEQFGGFQLRSTLIIKDISLENYGKYSCHAKNTIGESAENFSLFGN